MEGLFEQPPEELNEKETVIDAQTPTQGIYFSPLLPPLHFIFTHPIGNNIQGCNYFYSKWYFFLYFLIGFL